MEMADEVERMVTDEDSPKKDISQMTSNEVEKLEEAKLKAKFPIAGGGLSGHSAFLQKKLAKGAKYFDSGDYQMARQALPNHPMSRISQSISSVLMRTGDAIPTPESVPARKTSIIQSKYQHPAAPAVPTQNQNQPPSP